VSEPGTYLKPDSQALSDKPVCGNLPKSYRSDGSMSDFASWRQLRSDQKWGRSRGVTGKPESSFSCDGCFQGGRERDGEDGDVVLLSELLCDFGDRAGGAIADGLGSVEAEEFAMFVGGFDDSVG
jgi:hypothetical protein